MKKRAKSIIGIVMFFSIVAGLVLGMVLCGIHYYRYNYYGMFEYSIRDFQTHKHAYQTIAEKMIDAFECERVNNPNAEVLFIDQGGTIDSEKWEFQCISCDPSNERYSVFMNATEEEKNCFEEVRLSMRSKTRQGFYGIQVENGYVVFFSSSPYRIVYDDSGNYAKKAKDDKTIVMFNLSLKWYEVLVFSENDPKINS